MKHMSLGSHEAMALLFSDGSVGALPPGTDLARAKEEREFYFSTPGRIAPRIAKVRVEVLEILVDPTGTGGRA